VLSLDASPFVVAPGGDVYYANATEVGRVRTGSTRTEAFQVDVSVPHGLALDGDTLYVSDSGNGRILRVDLRTGRSAVHASGLRSALGIELEPGGSLLAAEHDTGRLLRIDAAGRVSVVASRLVKPYALDRAPDGSVFVVESGDDRRATGAIARVAADGTLTRLRLVPV
jgi:sugar lactone lactonase YvrE